MEDGPVGAKPSTDVIKANLKNLLGIDLPADLDWLLAGLEAGTFHSTIGPACKSFVPSGWCYFRKRHLGSQAVTG